MPGKCFSSPDTLKFRADFRFPGGECEPHRPRGLRAAYAELDFRIEKVGRFGRNLDGFRGNSTKQNCFQRDAFHFRSDDGPNWCEGAGGVVGSHVF